MKVVSLICRSLLYMSKPHRFRDEGGLDWAGGVREEGGSGERSDDKARWYDAVRTLPDRLWYDAVRTQPDRQWQQRPNIEEVDIATSVGDALWSCEEEAMWWNMDGQLH
jgi:hypothetical protein